MAERIDAIALNRGGYITLPAWRDDVGAMPTAAFVSVPDLGIEDQPATIMRDGLVRARVDRSRATAAGQYQAIWRLEVPIYGTVVLEDAPPPAEEIEVDTLFEVTADPALLKADRDWYTKEGFPTPAYIRAKQLFGIPPVDGDGRLLNDVAIQNSINAAIARLERELGIVLGRKLVSSLEGFDPILDDEGNPIPVIEEAGYDYDPSKFRQNYGFLPLRRYPVRALHQMELHVGPSRVAMMPGEWLKLNKSQGHIQLLPGTLTGIALPGSLAMPIVMGSYGGPVVPHLWRVAYEAGRDCTPDLLEVISWIATQVLLIIISDSVIAGIASQSVSIDGVSESISTTASATSSTFAANVLELEKRIKNWIEKVGPSYTGVRMMVV